MEIQTEKNQNVSILHVSGKIDAVTCSNLENAIMDLINADVFRIILNLAEVTYISSAGLRVLLVATKKLYGKGSFVLCNLQENVKEVIEMAGFANLITIYDTLNYAVEQIAE